MNDFVAPTTFPATMGSPGFADGVFPRTVAHFAGRTALAARPARVAILATGELDAALSLGFVPVAATDSNIADGVPPYLRARFPALALDAITFIGQRTAPDLARLAALQPDLIVGTQAGVHGRIHSQLAAIAPTVLMGGHGYNWKQDFLLFAEALGERHVARALMADYAVQAAALAAQRALRGEQRQTVSFARFGPKGLEVYGRHSFIDVIAADIGLARPAAQQFDLPARAVGPEQAHWVDADWLFYSDMDHPAARQAQRDFAPQWDALAAVRNGRACRIDAQAWYGNAGPAAAAQVIADIARAMGSA